MAASTRHVSPRKRRQAAQEAENIFNKKLQMKTIQPMTQTQTRLFDEYNRGQNILAKGTAGTGKTYVSTYLALKDVLEKNRYSKILFVRSAVQSREQGFMPGNLKAKEAYFETPFIDIVNDIFDRPDAYSILKQHGVIDFCSTSFIRGLTFNDTIIILDEAQNCVYDELRTVVTRLGNNSKILLCGDTMQDDLRNSKNRMDVSGLSRIEEIIEGIDAFSVITFSKNDIVRSELIKKFIIAEEDIMLKELLLG